MNVGLLLNIKYTCFSFITCKSLTHIQKLMPCFRSLHKQPQALMFSNHSSRNNQWVTTCSSLPPPPNLWNSNSFAEPSYFGVTVVIGNINTCLMYILLRKPIRTNPYIHKISMFFSFRGLWLVWWSGVVVLSQLCALEAQILDLLLSLLHFSYKYIYIIGLIMLIFLCF